MIRQDKFLSSQSLYAIDLSSLSRTQTGVVETTQAPLYKYEIACVWFKRRRGLNTANIGHLWDYSTEYCRQGDGGFARLFLGVAFDDGRYGATCRTRWDGERLWSDPAIDFEQQKTDARFLREMLREYPKIPAGYDGWWRY